MRDLPVYVVDTHVLFWYIEYPNLLSPAVVAVFRLAAVGEARIIVPAIVIAELYYLTQKVGPPILPSTMIGSIAQSREFTFSELSRAQLEAMEEVEAIPEMHDRLIAAEARVHQAPIITRDEVLRASGVVEVIW